MDANTSSGESLTPQLKKAKLAVELVPEHNILSSSPDLPHKQPMSRKQLHDDDDTEDIDDDNLEHSNLYGVKYMMWFELGIEGKDPIDEDEDDWGGKT